MPCAVLIHIEVLRKRRHTELRDDFTTDFTTPRAEIRVSEALCVNAMSRRPCMSRVSRPT